MIAALAIARMNRATRTSIRDMPDCMELDWVIRSGLDVPVPDIILIACLPVRAG